MLLYYLIMYHLINPSLFNFYYTYIVLYLISIVKYFLEFFLFPFIYLIILILYINHGDKSSDSEKFFVYIIDFIFRHHILVIFFDTSFLHYFSTPFSTLADVKKDCTILSKRQNNTIFFDISWQSSLAKARLCKKCCRLLSNHSEKNCCRILAKNLAKKRCIIQYFST